jgi:hypothetical protein
MKRKEEKELGPIIGMAPITRRPLSKAHLFKVPPPPNSTKPGTKPLTHGPMGDMLDSNYSRGLDF